ncbi:hypothetical protein ABXJ56_02540 [Microbacterium chocolatum]|uniref:hypothetical protein n=1 Tax=Microbacterium aurantiacum TaxID=162393 RepID=UPI00338E9586
MYMPPPAGAESEIGGPDGFSYGAVLVAADAAATARIEAVLMAVRFSGWIAPAEDGVSVVVGDPGEGIVAAGRRGIIEVGADLAAATGARALAARVRRDRQLGLVAFSGPDEIARYDSDPSTEPDADRDVIGDPVGAEQAPLIADLFGRADAAERLEEILDDELDPDSTFESERLRDVLRVLGLPEWVVGAAHLPKVVPTGPSVSSLIRLRAGRRGALAAVTTWPIRRLRARWNPAPILADPPRGSSGDEWMFL